MAVSGGQAGPTRKQLALTARGLITETYEPHNATAAVTLATGTFFGGVAGFSAGDVITNIVTCVGVVGAGAPPTLLKLGVVNTAGSVLAATADTSASSQWTAATGYVSFALSSPLTITTSGGYYLGACQVGAFATPVQFVRSGSSALAAIAKAFGSGAFTAVQAGGLTDLTGTLTLATAGGGSTLWFGAS